ncbi:hypothetical protein EC900091_5962, partial [Escherichia coli 90.0091]
MAESGYGLAGLGGG